MFFPLDFWDISLVFAIVSFVLLLLSTLMSSYTGNLAILLDKEKLEKAAIVFLILFLVSVMIKAVSTFLLP
jgi:hypothetical protein